MLIQLKYGIHGNTGWPLTPIPSSQYSLVSRLITSVRWCLTPTPALSSPTCVGGLLKHPNPPTPHLTEPDFKYHGPDSPPTLRPNIQPGSKCQQCNGSSRGETKILWELCTSVLGTCALGALEELCARGRPERDWGRLAGGELVSWCWRWW